MSAIAANAPTRRGSGALSASALVAPATIYVAAGLIVPLLILLRYSLNRYDPRSLMVEAVTFDNYVKFFSDPYYLGILWTTLRVAAFTTLLCLVLGLPLAYVLARTQSRFKNILVMLIVLPLFVSNAVRAAGWMTFLGTKGFLNALLLKAGVTGEPVEFMYTEMAVLFGIVAVNLPYMVLTLQSVIEGVPRNLEEAAFSLGAPPGTMFTRVLLPLVIPGVLAGSIFTFILAMNAYATPVLLGGPQFKMMGPLVFGQFQLNNWPFGAAIAFILMAATMTLSTAAHLAVRARRR